MINIGFLNRATSLCHTGERYGKNMLYDFSSLFFFLRRGLLLSVSSVYISVYIQSSVFFIYMNIGIIMVTFEVEEPSTTILQFYKINRLS